MGDNFWRDDWRAMGLAGKVYFIATVLILATIFAVAFLLVW